MDVTIIRMGPTTGLHQLTAQLEGPDLLVIQDDSVSFLDDPAVKAVRYGDLTNASNVVNRIISGRVRPVWTGLQDRILDAYKAHGRDRNFHVIVVTRQLLPYFLDVPSTHLLPVTDILVLPGSVNCFENAPNITGKQAYAYLVFLNALTKSSTYDRIIRTDGKESWYDQLPSFISNRKGSIPPRDSISTNDTFARFISRRRYERGGIR